MFLTSRLEAKGVDPDKKVRGTDWCVTQPFPAGGLGHFGTNVLKINSKSGPFSVAVYTFWDYTSSSSHDGATSSALANLDH